MEIAAALSRVNGQWLLDGKGVPYGLRVEAVESVVRQMRVPVGERLEMADELMRLGAEMVGCMRKEGV